MKRVSIEDKTKQFNLCRMKYEKKAFMYEELYKTLKEFGIASNTVSLLLKHGCFDKEIINGRNVYSFQKEPLHQAVMARVLKEHRDQNKKYRQNKKVVALADVTKQPVVGTSNLVNEAIKLLSNSDEYVIQKKVFDLDKFKRENPALYQKYLKFEVIV